MMEKTQSKSSAKNAQWAARIAATLLIAGLAGCASTRAPAPGVDDTDIAATQAAAKVAEADGSWSTLQGLSGPSGVQFDPIRVPAGADWPLGFSGQVKQARLDAGRAMASQEDGWQEKVARILAPLPADMQFVPIAQAAVGCSEKTRQDTAAVIVRMWTLSRGQTQGHSTAWRQDCSGGLPPPGVVADSHGKPLWLGAERRGRDESDATRKKAARELAARNKKKGPKLASELAEGDSSDSQGVEIVQTASVGATAPGWMWAKWRTKSLNGAEGEWQSGWFWFTPASSNLSGMGRPGKGALSKWKPAPAQAASDNDNGQ